LAAAFLAGAAFFVAATVVPFLVVVTSCSGSVLP
jgi:hypothetical protein